MRRSVVDIGMEILRAEGALQPEPIVTSIPEAEDDDEGEEDEGPSEIEMMKALADQLTVLADRLAVKETLTLLTTEVSRLTDLVVQLQVLSTQPRVKVPVRDEAGRIIEVREMVAPADETHGF